jgi:hypothetical protein
LLVIDIGQQEIDLCRFLVEAGIICLRSLALASRLLQVSQRRLILTVPG